ncbi:MAG: S46 family peptidase [Lentimicrobiaceae bacterium]|nr:S46 family peptidase [Lentimicrobiaceae bacterium]
MKKLFLIIVSALLLGAKGFTASLPDEGMWLPMFIERLNYVDMHKMGLQLTPEELYSINHSSLKDAIVGLAEGSAPNGYFCTAEVVSSQGLLFTNHHCGFGSIQEHSSLDHDYLTEGFWAMKNEEELPNEGMTASFLVRMEDVTAQVLANVKDNMSDVDRSTEIKKVISELKKKASEDGKYEVALKSFFSGNEYYMFVYKTYRDIRLVGAPPSSIGKFGGDTDNWMWPRHTGDFSILRIYSSPNGEPANYSKENVPMKTEYHLPISLKGVNKDDFAMIWGYPGGTERFLTSYGVKFTLEGQNPTLIGIWDKQLASWKEDMDASDEVRIKYSSKYFGISNGWKMMIGQDRMLKRLKVIDRKQQQENELMAWINADEQRKAKYGTCLQDISAAYAQVEKSYKPLYYYAVAGMSGIELIDFTQEFAQLQALLEQDKKDHTKKLLGVNVSMVYYLFHKDSKENAKAIDETIAGLKEAIQKHFKDYNMPTDRKTFAIMMELLYNDLPKENHIAAFADVEKKFKGDFKAYADYVYSHSIFATEEKLNTFLAKPSAKKLENDPAMVLMSQMMESQMKYGQEFSQAQKSKTKAERLFTAALREMNPGKNWYPDANSTMRFTYGKIKDYFPADAVHYDYITTLKGVMEKEDPTNEEFVVSQKLKDLYAKKDYGRYATPNGDMITCFLTTNDITGGNSGSPVMNANGELIGLAFDGNWEAMSGDIAYETEYQRTICVDIRYVLFVIDKYAGAKNIINELTIRE